MRVASWIVVLCAVVSITGVFLPSVEVRIAGISLGRRASLSLYQANTDREFVRKLLTRYARSPGKRVGEAIAAAMVNRVHHRAGEALDDARSAMSALDDVNDGDVRTVGRALAITIWAYLCLHVLMGGLIFGEMAQSSYRRSRLVVALVISLIVTATAITLHVICREAVAAANDEVGIDTLALGVGAYMMPIATVGGMIALVVLLARQLRRTPPAST